jgi:hypothetical protein
LRSNENPGGSRVLTGGRDFRDAIDATVAAMASERLATEVVQEQMMIAEGLK